MLFITLQNMHVIYLFLTLLYMNYLNLCQYFCAFIALKKQALNHFTHIFLTQVYLNRYIKSHPIHYNELYTFFSLSCLYLVVLLFLEEQPQRRGMRAFFRALKQTLTGSNRGHYGLDHHLCDSQSDPLCPGKSPQSQTSPVPGPCHLEQTGEVNLTLSLYFCFIHDNIVIGIHGGQSASIFSGRIFSVPFDSLNRNSIRNC